VSIRSINDGTLFGGRREETREDANEIRIRIIDFVHTNFLCGNSHVSIRSIKNGALFGGRHDETREDAIFFF
jgi:hypothetical protein